MADYYGDTQDDIRRRNATFFPNVTNRATAFTDTQARINALPRLARNQLQTYTLPSGGTVTIPIGSRLPSGYSANAATPAESNVIRQQGLAQGYYGTQPSQFPAPTAATGYAGGPYTQQGGVVNPTPNFPNVFQQFGSALSGVGGVAQGLYNLPATQAAIGYGQNLLGSLYTNLFGSRTTTPTQPGNFPSYAYRQPSIFPNQPRSYFDEGYGGY